MRRRGMATSRAKLTIALVGAGFMSMTMFCGWAQAQSMQEGPPELATPLEPLRPGVAESQLFSEVEAHNEMRRSALRDYAALRTYQVLDLKGKVHAEEVGRMVFQAPDKKTFEVTSESGSGVIRRMALKPLISSEIETAAGKQQHDSAISAENYSLDLLGEQQV